MQWQCYFEFLLQKETDYEEITIHAYSINFKVVQFVPLIPYSAMDKKRKLSFKGASFLKVLKDDFTNKLPIPAAFTKNFEGEIPPWFILEVAGTRKCCRVDIELDDNGGLYLGYGFDCFVEAHSLEIGNFMLFEHQNPLILQVKIYEKDGSERETDESEYQVGGASESPRQTPIICQEGNGSPGSATFKSEYRVRAASESPMQTSIIRQEEDASPWSASNALTSVHFKANKKQRGVIGNGRSNMKKCLMSATTEHGLRFSLPWMKATHYLYYLTIPRAMLVGKTFSNKDTITLKDGEGNCWPMELRLRADGRVDFARGWWKFVNDNDLTTGDTLTFEFVSNDVMQVQVKRASQVDNPSQREQDANFQPAEKMAYETEDNWCTPTPINSAPLPVAKRQTAACDSRNSFSLTWTDKTDTSYLHIPKAIANVQKLVNKDIVVLLDPEGKHWLLEVRTRESDGRVGLGRGWNNFIKSFGFEIGDTLNFQFVTDRMMKVQVTKACEKEHFISGDIAKQDVWKA